MFIILLIIIISSILSAFIARNKNLNSFDWAIFGLLVPVIIPVSLLTLSSNNITGERKSKQDKKKKKEALVQAKLKNEELKKNAAMADIGIPDLSPKEQKKQDAIRKKEEKKQEEIENKELIKNAEEKATTEVLNTINEETMTKKEINKIRRKAKAAGKKAGLEARKNIKKGNSIINENSAPPVINTINEDGQKLAPVSISPQSGGLAIPQAKQTISLEEFQKKSDIKTGVNDGVNVAFGAAPGKVKMGERTTCPTCEHNVIANNYGLCPYCGTRLVHKDDIGK